MVADKTGFAGEHRPINRHAVDRVDAVEDEIFLAIFRRRFHRQPHGRSISIKPAADVLDVEHQRIELLDLFGLGFHRCAV